MTETETAGAGAGAEDLRLHHEHEKEDTQHQLSLTSTSTCVTSIGKDSGSVDSGADADANRKHNKPQSRSGAGSRDMSMRRPSLPEAPKRPSLRSAFAPEHGTSTSSSRRLSFSSAALNGRSGLQAMKSLRSVAGSVHRLIFSNDPGYKRLQDIEKRRRAILKRTDLGFFRMLFFWDGTCLQAVLSEAMLWITMLIYVLVRVGAYTSLPTFVSEIGSTDITTVGAFVTFFMVFHTNNTVTRFHELYMASMQCKSSIFDCASLASSTLPHDRALRLVRYMNAAHIAGYVGLSETYGYQNFFCPMNESKQFLTEQELTRIEYINMDEGGNCHREIVVWCFDEITDALKNGVISETVAWDLRQCILKLRRSCTTMYDYNDQPIPFFLTHFAVLMMVIFLPLVSVSYGLEAGTGDNVYWLRDIVEGIVVFLQAVVLLGLRTLADMLSDP